MAEDVQLRTYTVSDIKNWLIHNHPKEGLSSRVIAPARAYAIANNPYVQDGMKVVCALFVNGQVAAFTAAFPEILQKPEGLLAWWFSTLWCDSRYEGRGYGLVVVGTLVEEYGIENCFDAEGAPETVAILHLLGLKTVYHHRYVFSEKHIHIGTLKGKAAWCLDRISKILRVSRIRACRLELAKHDYSVVYQQFIDDDAYRFILNHSQSDKILRRQDSFNWILRYPFLQVAPEMEMALPENKFSSLTENYQSFFLKVIVKQDIIGVAMIVMRDGSMSIKYMYYEKSFSHSFFSSLLLIGIRIKAKKIETGDKQFADFLSLYKLFPSYSDVLFSFSTPVSFVSSSGIAIQLGEGDMFV